MPGSVSMYESMEEHDCVHESVQQQESVKQHNEIAKKAPVRLHAWERFVEKMKTPEAHDLRHKMRSYDRSNYDIIILRTC